MKFDTSTERGKKVYLFWSSNVIISNSNFLVHKYVN